MYKQNSEPHPAPYLPRDPSKLVAGQNCGRRMSQLPLPLPSWASRGGLPTWPSRSWSGGKRLLPTGAIPIALQVKLDLNSWKQMNCQKKVRRSEFRGMDRLVANAQQVWEPFFLSLCRSSFGVESAGTSSSEGRKKEWLERKSYEKNISFWMQLPIASNRLKMLYQLC